MRYRALITGRHDSGILWSLRRSMPFVDENEDALLLVGDRYETALAAVEATRARTPIVHLHGGEVTEGASDEQFRNAITKMAHLHLVSTAVHGARVVAMGEDPATVHVVGAPGLDNLHRDDLPGRQLLEARLGVELKPPVVIVTLHPATLGEDSAVLFLAVRQAMRCIPATYVITTSNTDPGHDSVRWERTVYSLGERDYWGLMKVADAMLGNSSSGLIEAPAVQLPVVNVGDRQKGRLRGDNVVDAPPLSRAIAEALFWATQRNFRDGLGGTFSPYGDGHSGPRIAKILSEWTPPKPPRKRPVAC
jgi:UDP-hydrolysing UDP-N-acetyl-D-glucosamine 2-epimerase